MAYEHVDDRPAAVRPVRLPQATAGRLSNPVRSGERPNEIAPKAPERPAHPLLKRRKVDSGEVFRSWAFR